MNAPIVRWLLDIGRIPADAADVHWVWSRPLPGWLWLLLGAAAIAFALWSYTRLQAARPARILLASARAMLLMLLLVILSGPALEHPRESVERDWVLVLADRSRSMEIRDVTRAADERVSRDEQMASIVDESGPVWQAIGQERRVRWFGFHAGAFDLPVVAGAPTLGDADGERTRLDPALRHALQQVAGRPISGVVVLSDGRTTDPPGRSVLRQLQADAIPVFAVPLGSADPIGDVGIRRVASPRRAFVQDKVPVVVELERLGTDGSGQVTLRLLDSAGGAVLDELTVSVDDEQAVLTAEPQLAGDVTWVVEVDTAQTDLMPENNRQTLEIELVDRPLRVLFVAGYPRWEYQFLKTLLLREKSIESSIMLLSADRDFAQEGNQPITRVPRSPEEFARYDVMIIGDVPGTFFSSEQLAMMRDQVSRRGSGLLWIGGPRHTPESYAGTDLADLLPMRGGLALPAIDRPVNMVPTDLADRLGILQLAVDDKVGWPKSLSEASYGWSQLRYAQHIEPGRLKPTAEVLAETALPFRGTPLPLAINMRYGAGQIIYVATDETWRWRFGRGELLPEQFWIQMIRMLGRDTLRSGDAAAQLDVSPRRSLVGQPVRIDLRILDTQLADSRRTAVPARITRGDGSSVTGLSLQRADPEAERYVGTFTPNRPGLLRVEITDSQLAERELVGVVDVVTPDDELRRPETDHEQLAALASATGGQVLPPARLAELDSLLPNRAVRTLNPLTESVWDTPLFFLLVLTALTLEWVGRKMIRLI